MLETTILGILQGVAEFLPISSSGHLVIGQHLLGVNAPGMRLDVFLHLGTLISIFAFYRREIGRLIAGLLNRTGADEFHAATTFALKILVSALPAIAVYFCFHDFIDGLFENSRMVGVFLMFTGAVLVGTRFLPGGRREVGFGRALAMGFAQALALLPGVSRSGMTLAMARGGRIAPEKSAEFSFLMSAPLIAGATLLELLKALRTAPSGDAAEIGWGLTLYGGALAAVVGYLSLKLLVRVLNGRGFWLFGPYCLLAGLLTLLFCR